MTNNTPNNFVRFLRNNTALLVIIFCVLAISAVVIVASFSQPSTTVVTKPDNEDNKQAQQQPEDTQPTITTQRVFFGRPVDGDEITMEYSDLNEVMFVYNTTLGQWQTHRALDIKAEENSDVVAMFDGTVVDVGETFGYGNTVKIDHGNGVVATYAGLNNVHVLNGQTVSKNDVIGTVGTTASYEFADGAHLHLEVTENGNTVNPLPYVQGEVYREIEVTSAK